MPSRSVPVHVHHEQDDTSFNFDVTDVTLDVTNIIVSSDSSSTSEQQDYSLRDHKGTSEPQDCSLRDHSGTSAHHNNSLSGKTNADVTVTDDHTVDSNEVSDVKKTVSDNKASDSRAGNIASKADSLVYENATRQKIPARRPSPLEFKTTSSNVTRGGSGSGGGSSEQGKSQNKRLNGVFRRYSDAPISRKCSDKLVLYFRASQSVPPSPNTT